MMEALTFGLNLFTFVSFVYLVFYYRTKYKLYKRAYDRILTAQTEAEVILFMRSATDKEKVHALKSKFYRDNM